MIALVVGTRPEIIKMAPVIRALEAKKVPFLFIHSNQHYSENMDKNILADLKLPKPDINLNAGSGSHAMQTGKIMLGIEEVCMKHKPNLVLVHGDTNTTLASALAAKKLQVKVGHIEAGLRSFDYAMPEEINRILTDRISDYMFAPTLTAKENLLKEGISATHILVTGNTVVDALQQHISLVNLSRALKKFGIRKEQYTLVTVHRPENTDKPEQFKKLLHLLEHAHSKVNTVFLWPIHPRTKAVIEQGKYKLPSFIKLIEPLGYLEMLAIMQAAQLILTDSGGVQEEAYLLHKPLITLRTSTERPETLSANFIVGLDTKKFTSALLSFQEKKVSWSDTLGDGNAAEKIVTFLKQKLNYE